MTKWVSVKDRLPENIDINNPEIVIITNGHDRRAGWYHPFHKEWWHWKGESSLSTDEYSVTHWMPLPEPPKC